MDLQSLLSIIFAFIPILGTIPGWMNIGKILKVRSNILKSCTMAISHSSPDCQVGTKKYSIFSLKGYRKVPFAYKTIRWLYTLYKTLCLFAIFLFGFAVALPVYIAIILLSTHSIPGQPGLSTPKGKAILIPPDKAIVLIVGAVLVGISLFVVGLLMRSFEEYFLDGHIDIDIKGNKKKVM